MARSESQPSIPTRLSKTKPRATAVVLAASLFAWAPSPLFADTGTGAPEQAIRFSDFQDQAFVEARRSGSPLVLYFEADWCGPCKELHAKTFTAPAVIAAAAGFKLFRVDMTEPDRHAELVKKSFQVTGFPTVILFGANGQEAARRFGFIPPEVFATMLEDVRKKPGRS